MCDGYIHAILEALGDNVKVVVDRFHVAKKYRECVDTLCKKELKRLKQELTDDEYTDLKGAMWALRKQEEKLSNEENLVLKNLFNHSPAIQEAYKLHNELTNIFNTNRTKKHADKARKWVKKATKSPLICFDKFISTLTYYWNEISSYFHRTGPKDGNLTEQ